MNVCIIPARGGSKRIPKKNIKNFRNKPMISWSIKSAIKSGIFKKILVSTDDKEIANISLNEGAEVPFLRPKEISGDYSSTQEVIKHSIEWMMTNGIEPNIVCCLYATSPFTTSNDLNLGLKKIVNSNFLQYLFTVTSFEYPIQRSFRINKEGHTEMLFPENYHKRSQDLESIFHDAGQFYMAKKDKWLSDEGFFQNGLPLIIPRWRVQDIDTEEDWIRAEKLHQILNY